MTEGSAAGRVVLLTGAAGGIGQATAELLAAQGYRLGLLDSDPERRLETIARDCAARGEAAVALRCDLAVPEQCRAAVEQLSATLGGVDILINNAATYPLGPWGQVSLAEWNQVLAVNLSAQFLLAQLTAPHMQAQRWGRIVNLSSVTFHVAMRDRPHYIASKGGVVGLTRALARELGDWGITVNSVTPGAIATPAEARLLGSEERRREWDTWVFERQCLQRRGVPTDIARAIAFLISDAATFITGQDLVVDGGWTMH